MNLLNVMRRFRISRIERVASFTAKFPWLSFALQAPQVTASIWGVGLQLGGVMGMISESMYGAVRRALGSPVIVRGPPPSDPVGKAIQYLTGGSPHYGGGAWLSYEDHWTLLAADIVAAELIMANFPASSFDASVPEWLDGPLVYREPWHASTLQALTDLGWRPDMPVRPAVPGVEPGATHRDLLGKLAADFPSFLNEARVDFPVGVPTVMYQNAAADLAQRILTWGTGSDSLGAPVYDDEEYVFARMFEHGIFPPMPTDDGAIARMVSRAVDIGRAVRGGLPGRNDMISAANEVWGSYSEV